MAGIHPLNHAPPLPFNPAPTPISLQRALLCVKELNSASLLYVLVQRGIEMIFKRRTIARERIGLLLYHLVKEGTLPPQQFYRG